MPNSEELQVAFTKGWPKTEGYAQEMASRIENLEAMRDGLVEDTPIFDDLAKEIHPVNVEKGFWGEPEFMDKVAAKLALVHSEVTEVLEALRKSQGTDKVTEEFADIFIRCFDLYGVLVEKGMADPGLYAVMRSKMEKNAARPPKHGHVWG